ncbi:MAG: ADP-ribosylation/crystallin J1 [Planctomycetes bacterium]|nr:ADP-ribosylation/crystallin J1 [Planctomycetota bacterium]
MILFRPVGLKELELIASSSWRAFPPRLSWQPIFYPVITHEYARLICTTWNSKESEAGHVGFVTSFEVEDGFAARYPIQDVGGRACQELWVPAEELYEFNRHIMGVISVVESVYGDGWVGDVDPDTQLPKHIAATLPKL